VNGSGLGGASGMPRILRATRYRDPGGHAP
jgi:hypothetical protein